MKKITRKVSKSTLINYYRSWKKIVDRHTDEQNDLMHEMKSYLDQYFDDPIPITELVKMSGLNVTTFYKEFKDYTGYAPLQYLTNKRIDRAKHFLLTTSIPISDIAHKVGYQDVYYFSRVFKRTVGVSPKKFSELCKRKFFVLTPAFTANLLALGIAEHLLYPLSQSDIHSFLKQSRKREVNLDELSLWEPQCIICRSEKRMLANQLQKIAPISLVPYKNLSWREQLFQLANVIGSKELAQRWLNQYDKRLHKVRKKVKQKVGNDKVVAIRMLDKKIRIFGVQRRKLSDFLYRELKLNAPAMIKDVFYYDLDYDSNELCNLDIQHILLIVDPGKEEQISLVKNKLKGNIYEVDSIPWLSYSAWGHERILTEALEVFA